MDLGIIGDNAYGDVHAQGYDALFGDRDDVRAVADVLHGLAGDGAPALEFGVGTGRLAIPLARLGHRVHWVDNSRAMLERLEEKVAEVGDADVVGVLGDFSHARVFEPVSLVYCAFSTLFLPGTQALQLATLANAAAHLELGGRMLVEFFVHDRTRFTDCQQTSVERIDEGGARLHVARLAPNAQTIHMQKIELGADGTRFVPNRLRFIYPAELDLMARLAGFEVSARWSNWARAPFEDRSENLIAVLTKVADGPY